MSASGGLPLPGAGTEPGAGTATGPAFERPWHAQAFALTHHLCEAGHFDWLSWTERFGATLARHGLERELDGGDDYFLAWLDTLESLLSEIGLAAPGETGQAREAWRRAFLETPHGAPVRCRE